jgi:NADH dehydrogenase FAD-containing subunit
MIELEFGLFQHISNRSLHEAIGGGRDVKSLLTPLGTRVFARKGKASETARVVVGKVVKVVGKSVVVAASDGREVRVEFDSLVVATGCSYGLPIRDSSTVDLEGRTQELQNWSKTLAAAKSVLIVGGGAVGVELAAEIACRKDRDKSAKITLATAATELVADLPEKSRVRAHETLLAMGVDVLFECRAKPVGCVKACGAGKFELTQNKGSTTNVDVDAAIFCFGGPPNTAWLASSSKEDAELVKMDARGFVERDDSLRCAAEFVYVVGDAAAKPDAQRLASFAHFEGEYVAHAIIARKRNKAKPVPYYPPPRMVALSLGPRDGVFVYDGYTIPIPGFLVPLLKAAIEAWFVRLLPMPYALLSILPGDLSARMWTKPPKNV